MEKSHSRNDIFKLLKGYKMAALAKSGNLVEVMEYVFKWGHGLTLQVGLSKCTEEGVNQWIKAMNSKCVIGNNVEGGAKCTTHGVVRCFKITTTNSLQTQIRRMERENISTSSLFKIREEK